MDNPTAFFHYASSLHNSVDKYEIRLLYIDPGHSNSPLTCQLKHASLSTNPVYDAISYCWGGLSASESILCDGFLMPITPSLHDALRRFRSTDKVTVVWADAICINQADLAEKSHQVPLMGMIYSLAREVQVWLGPSNEETPTVVHLIEKLNRLAQKSSESLKLPLEQLFDLDSNKWEQVNDLEVGPEWVPFLRFLENPWFSRVWIIQEVALARGCAWLHCGDTVRVWWQEVVTAIFFAFQSGILTTAVMSLDDPNSTMTAHRVAALARTTTLVIRDIAGEGVDLLWLLYTNSPALATNPLDKVYAILGMAKNEDSRAPGRRLISPDYRLDTVAAYQNVAEIFLERYPKLFILEGAGLRAPHSSQTNGLPSWVIDWNYEEIGDVSSTPNLDETYLDGTTSFDASLTERYPKIYHVNGRVLELSGIVLDEIIDLGIPFSLECLLAAGRGLSLMQRGMLSLTGFKNLVKIWNFSLPPAYDYTNEPMIDAFFNTMMKGIVPPSLNPTVGSRGLRDLLRLGKIVSAMESSPLAWTQRGRAGGLSLVPWLPPIIWTSEAMSALPHLMQSVTDQTAFKSRNGCIGLARSHQLRS